MLQFWRVLVESDLPVFLCRCGGWVDDLVVCNDDLDFEHGTREDRRNSRIYLR